MPEFKRNFTAGKMNKDLNERLIPKGEYRDAMNIEVSTSEGSDVGTVQNILGNKEIDGQNIVPLNSVCVGTVADERNDALYWFTTQKNWGSQGHDKNSIEHTHPQGITNAKRDIIWEYKDNRVRPVFCATGLISYVAYHSSGSNITWNTVNNRIQFPFSIDGALLVGMNVEIMGVNASGNIENHVGFTVTQIAGSNVYVDGDIDFLNNSTTQDDLEDTKFFFSCAEENTTALNFDHDKIITGINIIDDMLFWTDGYDEPKKINIPRSMEGTSVVGGVVTPTKLINQAQDIATNDRVVCKKEHITVIRKAPKTVLTIQTETDPNFAFGTTLDINFLIDPSNPALGNVTGGMGASFSILLLKDATSTAGLNTNDVVLFNPATSSLPNDTYEVSGILTNQVNSGSADYVDASGNVLAPAGTYVIWDVAVQQISFLTTTNDLEYNWAVKIPEIEKFKNKFTRFSYRYKYLDGEYSSYAPFTPVVFKPKNFKYNVKEAYNIGMENNISKIVLSGYNSNLPLDVSGIELLYKESHSPVVYSIDTIRKSNNLTSTTSSYEVRSNQIKAALPENQLLRPWDNVPRTSLAQEVTGSRIVYGNYLQNYNIKNSPILNAELVSREDCDVNSGYKSLKSMRNYTLGVSYLDEYGRQSPVFTNKSAVVQIPINKSNKKNQVSTTLVGNAPDWAKHYKVFIKQTADEYYNMAMDRIYDAKDGNIWLSFPSSDRNKIDDETFLILKKGVDDQVVSELNRYKVLAIENEAPTFIKTKNSFVSSVQEDGTGAFLYFTNPSSYPIEGSASISIEKTPWDTVNIPLSDIPLMTVQFTTQNSGGATQYTQVYDVTSFAEDTSAVTYDLSLNKGITEDWVNDAANVSLPDSTIGIRVSKKTVENRPEFDGRFFVKVTRDIILDEHVISQGTANQVEQVAAQLPFYYLADGLNGNGINTTSNNTSNDEAHWDTLLDPTGNGIDSMWFIDSAFYSGYYDDPNILQYCGVIGCGTLGMTHDNRTNPPTKNETGYKKGIYTEGGQAYIDLSFGYIKAADGAGATSSYGYAMHTDASDTDRVSDSAWSLISADFLQGGPTTGGDKNSFFQEVGDHPGNGHDNWESNDDLIKHWSIGSSLNTNHNSDENVAIVTKLVQNSRFRFTNDPNQTVYTISGTPEVTYNFNYKNLGSYYDNLDQIFDDAVIPGSYDQYTGLSGYSGGSFFPFLNFTPYSPGMIAAFDSLNQATKATNKRVTWKIPITCEDGPDDPTDAASSYNPLALITATTPGTIQFIEKVWESIDDQVVPDNPAIWETEPKLDVDLDIYYEVDGTFPLEVNTKTNYTFAPVGSSVSIQQPANETPVIQPNTTVVSWRGDVVELSIEANNVDMEQNMQVVFSRADGSCVTAKLKDLAEPITLGAGDTSFFLQIEPNVSNEPVKLSWFNCYSFGNGVESNRIRDDYNQVKIDKGVKASSTLDEPYQEEHRKHGLIYSGLYNSTSGVNELNQFIAAEKITKDLNPTYGSIQKLKAGWGQGGDLIALCEDRVLKILANKDALFNADGNSNVTSTNRVLGQAIPYSGEYGISTNPESFASEAYRAYFTDRVRGTVMRLSMDGLTPISNYGMSDWFKDNLRINNTLVGNFDDKKNEYNLSLRSVISVKAKVLGSAKGSAPCGPRTAGKIFILTTHEANKINVGDAVSGAGIVTGSIVDSKSNMGGGEWELTLNTNMVGGFLGTPYGYGALGSCDVYWWTTMYIGGKETPTISFAEKVKGWSSFKSFIPEQGKSMANNYYTFKSGKVWVHHAGTVPRNTFYGGDSDKSWVEVVMNDIPSSVKSFKAVDYEGSQAKVTPNLDANNQLINDGEYFNLLPENGWYVSDFYTNLESGSVTEFVEKEGKWFGHTIGSDISINDDGVINNNYTTSDFSVQGVGSFVSTTVNTIIGCMCDGVVNDCYGDGLAAFNYSPAASMPCGGQADPNNCCVPTKLGCIDPLASNFDPLANTDNGSCVYLGCMDEFGPNGILNSNYDPNANASDSSCVEYIPGCTDSTMFNFSATATIACGGNVPMPGDAFGQANNYCCVEVIEGCIDPNADAITPAGANTNNNTCTYTGCTDPLSPNYDFAGSTVDGTTSNQADLAYQYGYAADNGQCNTITPVPDGCTDPTADNYQVTATNDDGSCYYCNSITPITPTPISADPTTLTNNYFEASVSQHETYPGAQDGIIHIAIPSGSPFGFDSNPALIDSNGNGISSVLNMGGVYAFDNLAPGDYDITITQGPTGPLSNPNIPCVVSFNNVITINAGAQVYGCTDGDGTFNNHIMSDSSTGTHAACNYNPLATLGNPDAANCDYSTCVGCMDSTATNYDSNYTIPDNGECNYSGPNISGCTDPIATNYDAAATVDDGTCTYAPVTYQVGDSALGGIVAYILQSGDAGYDANVQHGIIVATTDNADAPWGCYGTALSPNASGEEVGDGSQNTIDIIAGCNDTLVAAEIASNYTDGTYTDWFLPSKQELNKVYHGVGYGGTGTNSNGDSNMNIANIPPSWYWSSSESGSQPQLRAFSREFSGGGGQTTISTKNIALLSRSVRYF